MSVVGLGNGDRVTFKDYFTDENRNFRPGDSGRVSGHDGPLVIVCVPPESGYRISVLPALLKPASKN